MGLMNLWRRVTEPRGVPRSAIAELFDDDFQKKLEMLAIVSRKVFAGRTHAERRSKKRGSGIEFADHRDYVEGDDFRAVDWQAYQRLGRLLVRLYEEEEDLSIYFLLDCSASAAFPDSQKFNQARRLCAALAYVGLANLDRVSVVAISDNVQNTLPVTRGKGKIFQVLRFLEQQKPGGVTDLEQGLHEFVAQHRRRGLAVLLSDLYDPKGFERGINVLRFNKFEPFVLHLVDPRDKSPEMRGDVRIVDCETGESREVTVTDALLKKLSASITEYEKSVMRFCASRQVPYFAAPVDLPFEEVVLRVFRQGGFLR